MKGFVSLLLSLAAFGYVNAACVLGTECMFHKRFNNITEEFKGNLMCIHGKPMIEEDSQVIVTKYLNQHF